MHASRVHDVALGVLALFARAQDLLVGDVGVKLHADRRRPVGEGLVRECTVRCGKQPGSARKLAAVAMPLVDVVGKRTDGAGLVGAEKRAVADFLLPATEARAAAKVLGQHLSPKADAEERHLLL